MANYCSICSVFWGVTIYLTLSNHPKRVSISLSHNLMWITEDCRALATKDAHSMICIWVLNTSMRCQPQYRRNQTSVVWCFFLESPQTWCFWKWSSPLKWILWGNPPRAFELTASMLSKCQVDVQGQHRPGMKLLRHSINIRVYCYESKPLENPLLNIKIAGICGSSSPKPDTNAADTRSTSLLQFRAIQIDSIVLVLSLHAK